MASGKAIGATLVLGGGGATAGAAMGGAFSSKSEEQTQESPQQNVPQPSIVPEQEPADIDVFTTTDLTSSTYSSSILSKMKESNLSSIVKSVSATKQAQTKSWWEWKWKKKFNNNKPSDAPFNTVTQAYEDKEDTISLNQACEKAYRKVAAADYVFTTTLLDNIKKFCTKTLDGIDVSEPKSTNYTEAKNDGDYKLGVLTIKDANAKKLVDAASTKTDNDLWFKWAFEKRLKPVKATSSSYFSGLEKGVKETSDSEDKSLKTACDSAYKKDKYFLSDDGNKLLTEIGKFCASDIFVPTLPTVAVESEPANVQTFANNEEFTDTKNKDYKDKVLSLMKKAHLPKIVKYDHLDNRSWWDWAFKKVWEDKKGNLNGKIDPLFTSINKGYSDKETEKTALNQACHLAYKEDKTKYVVTTDNKLLKSISVFCTKGDDANEDLTEPEAKLMSKNDIGSEYTDSIFKSDKSRNLNKLVKPVDAGSKLWWEWVHEHVFKKETGSVNSHFTKETNVKIAYSDQSSGENHSKALNQVCDAAYKKSESDLKSGNSPTIYSDVQRFCTPKGITLDTLS